MCWDASDGHTDAESGRCDCVWISYDYSRDCGGAVKAVILPVFTMLGVFRRTERNLKPLPMRSIFWWCVEMRLTNTPTRNRGVTTASRLVTIIRVTAGGREGGHFGYFHGER